MCTGHIKLSHVANVTKGLSYKGEFLDRDGPKLVGLGAIGRDATLLLEKARQYGGSFKPAHAIRTDDLLIALTDITQTGDTLGTAVLATEEIGQAIFSHHIGAIRIHEPGRVLPEFLYYSLQTRRARAHFASVATGTTVRAVSANDAGELMLPIPDIDEQRRVVDLLRPIDEKIRLNKKIENELNTLIASLFRESAFRAANYGSSDVSLADLIDFDPRTPTRKGTPYPFVDMKSLPTAGPIISNVSMRPYKGGTKFLQGDTLFARITPCLENGKTGLVTFLADHEVGTGSTEFVVMRPRRGVSRFWVYCLARQDEFRRFAMTRMTGSSGRQRVSASALASFQLPAVDSDSMIAFDRTAQPIFAKLASLMAESNSLFSLRSRAIGKILA